MMMATWSTEPVGRNKIHMASTILQISTKPILTTGSLRADQRAAKKMWKANPTARAKTKTTSWRLTLTTENEKVRTPTIKMKRSWRV